MNVEGQNEKVFNIVINTGQHGHSRSVSRGQNDFCYDANRRPASQHTSRTTAALPSTKSRYQNANNEGWPVPISRNHPDGLSSEWQNSYAGDQACPSGTLDELLKTEERAANRPAFLLLPRKFDWSLHAVRFCHVFFLLFSQILIKFGRFIFRDAQCLPVSRAEMFCKQNDLADVIGVVRQLPVDRFDE